MPTEPAGHRDVLLRPATQADVEEIANLYLVTRRASVPAMPPQIHTAAEVREHTSREIADNEVWLAADPEGDDVLGFLVLTGAWLDSLYVAPDQQSGGIGSTLLDLAKAQRPGGFSLWVFASNAPARGFYLRHGLVELEHTDGSANEERSPDLRMAWPGTEPVAFLRREIDAVDDELAVLLARRTALTAAVQEFKRTPGRQGRDLTRERQIAQRMARHAPGLGVDAVARIMHVVIGESLDSWEDT